MAKIELEELNKIVDSIKSGNRIVLFPPGLFIFISTILLLIFSTVILSGSLVSSFGDNLTQQTKAIIQFSTFIPVIAFVIAPSFMLTRGGKKYASIKEIFIIILTTISLISAVISFITVSKYSTPFIVSTIFSFCAYLLIKSSHYLLFKEFFFLLKNRPPENN